MIARMLRALAGRLPAGFRRAINRRRVTRIRAGAGARLKLCLDGADAAWHVGHAVARPRAAEPARSP